MFIATQNNLIACSVFPKQHVDTVIKGGIAMVDKKVQLQVLEVVYPGTLGDTPILAGDSVWVRGDATINSWAKEVFEIEPGKPFVLVPANHILIHRTKAY